MRTPIDLHGFTAEVIYPSSIFSLERHESLPFERFTFNVFRDTIATLGQEKLPLRLILQFTEPNPTGPAWLLNCYVKSLSSTDVVVTPSEMLPTLMMMLSSVMINGLFSPDGRAKYGKDPELLKSDIQRFIDGASAAARGYKEYGLATAIRTGYNHLALGMNEVDAAMDQYDSLAYTLVNHEIGHIYSGQLSAKKAYSLDERSAFEFMADLFATEWLFRRYIYFTPDNPDYRRNRNFKTHAEAIVANSKWAIETLVSYLVLMGIAGLQRNGKTLNFAGGIKHPGGFGRYWIQQQWLITAIEGHFESLIGKEGSDQIYAVWTEYFEILCKAGIVSRPSLSQVWDEKDNQLLSLTADLIESLQINELFCGVDFLRSKPTSAEKIKVRIK